MTSRSSINWLTCSLIAVLSPVAALRAQSDYATPYTFTTLAGAPNAQGFADGTVSIARFNYPSDVAVDSTGNVYVADTNNNTIRKITGDGVVTTLAGRSGVPGSTDGVGSAALFNGPTGIAVDSAGNLYIGDFQNATIRKITSNGTVTTLAGTAGITGFADGTGGSAQFASPFAVAVDSGSNVYVADLDSCTIRKITSTGTVTTFAGSPGQKGSVDGTGSAARFGFCAGVAVDSTGNVYVTDSSSGTIRKISSSGVTTTLAGSPGITGSADGVGSSAQFNNLYGIAVDSAGNIYVSDNGNGTIRKITGGGVVTTLAGSLGNSGSSDGTGSAALFNHPVGVAVDSAGSVYVADGSSDTVRWGALAPPALTSVPSVTGTYGQSFNYSVTFSNADLASYSVTGLPPGLSFNSATGVISGTLTADIGTYTVALTAVNGAGTGTGTLTLAVGGGGDVPGAPTNVSVVSGDGQATVYFTPPVLTGGSAISEYKVTATPTVGSPVTAAGASSPITVTGLTNGTAYTFTVAAVNSVGSGAAASYPIPIWPEGPITYSTSIFATLPSGSSGPNGVAVDGSGNVYVTVGNALEKVTSTGTVTLVAGSLTIAGSADGTGAAAAFSKPTGLATDSSGNIYVADSGNNSIRRVNTLGMVTTLAGLVEGHADGVGVAAQFNNPTGVAVDGAHNVYVADTGNNELRKVTPNGTTTTLLRGSSFTFANLQGLFQTTYSITGAAVDALGNPYAGVMAVAPAGLVSAYNAFALEVQDSGGFVQAFEVSGGFSDTESTYGDGALAASGHSGLFALAGGNLWNGGGVISSPQDLNPKAIHLPVAIAADSSGRVYEAVPENNSIVVVTPVGSLPNIATQPVGGTIVFGASMTLSVSASGTPPPTYQWQVDGVNIAGATSSSYVTSMPGTYTVVIANSAGTVKSGPVIVTAATRLLNISSRAYVGTGANVEIAGFVVTGPPGTTEQVLVRGVGPALSQFGVTGLLTQPVLTLFDSKGNQMATNTGWNTALNAAQIAAAITSTGAFALPLDSADSALLVSLAPGTYTAEINGLNSTTGVALAEVYEVQQGDPELINISTRAFVNTGSSVEIGGFVVKGSKSAKVLVRAVGPALSQFGVAGVLAQPSLSVVDSSGNTVASNTGWSTNSDPAAIVVEMAAVGAFALSSGSADCALVLTLPPGAYTAVVSGVNGTSGVALVEVYQAP